MAGANCTRLCAHCGDTISPRINKTTGLPSKAERRYCSPSCCQKAADKRYPSKSGKAPLRLVACCGCGVTQQRRVRNDEAGRYCGRKCHADAMTRVAAERAALFRIACAWRTKPAPNPLVVAEIRALRRIAKYVERPRIVRKACSGCGDPVLGVLGYRKLCHTCKAKARRDYNKTPIGRAHKKKSKAIRRSRVAIYTETVDPISVFDRDRWICQLCGKRTPRRLRGLVDPSAPELDHIIPLALGGAHAWFNVQCACRECNGRKGAKVLGQTGLPLVA